jgi:hypothetical protein
MRRMQLQLNRMVALLPTNQAGSRFRRLMTAAKKGRMHHFFVLAGTMFVGGNAHWIRWLSLTAAPSPACKGPYGSSLMNAMAEVAEPQRLTYMRLFQACGDLWLKEQSKAGLKDLQLRVIEAVCLAELHLPASEADIKMHDLIHLAFQNIPLWGECAGSLTAGWIMVASFKSGHPAYLNACLTVMQGPYSPPPCSQPRVPGGRSDLWPETGQHQRRQ